MVTGHFYSVIGYKAAQSMAVDWQQLNLPSVHNRGLDNPFTSDEVWATIKDSSIDKDLGPDGVICVFFRSS